MVIFRTLKYKHFEQSLELLAQFEAGEVEQSAVTDFVMSLVEDWDYIDPETKKKVPIGEPAELTIEQYNDCMDEFSRQMDRESKVKKTNGKPLPFGLTESKPAGKLKQNRRAG